MATDMATLGIKVDSRPVVEASRDLDKLEKSGKRAEKATDSLGNSFKKLAGVAGMLATAFGAFKLAQLGKDAVLLAGRYETLGISMQVVGDNAGYSSVQMFEYEKQLRKTGISMVEARASITKMASAQIDLANSSKLARIAQDAAVIGNINSSEAFGRLVHGIQSAQVEVLRNIGIQVNFETAYKKSAAAMDRTTASLTEHEKMQIRVNAVMTKGEDISGVYQASLGSWGKMLNSLKRYWDDLKTSIGVVASPVMVAIVTDLTTKFKSWLEAVAGNTSKLEQWAAVLVYAYEQTKLLSVALLDLSKNALNAVINIQTTADSIGAMGSNANSATAEVKSFTELIIEASVWSVTFGKNLGIAFGGIAGIVGTIGAGLLLETKNILTGVLAIFQGIGDAGASMFWSLVNVGSAAIKKLSAGFTSFQEITGAIFKGIKGQFKDMIDNLKVHFAGWLGKMKSGLESLPGTWQLRKTLAGAATSLLEGVDVKNLNKDIEDRINETSQKITASYKKNAEATETFNKAVRDSAKDLAGDFGDALKYVDGKLSETAKNSARHGQAFIMMLQEELEALLKMKAPAEEVAAALEKMAAVKLPDVDLGKTGEGKKGQPMGATLDPEAFATATPPTEEWEDFGKVFDTLIENFRTLNEEMVEFTSVDMSSMGDDMEDVFGSVGGAIGGIAAAIDNLATVQQDYTNKMRAWDEKLIASKEKISTQIIKATKLQGKEQANAYKKIHKLQKEQAANEEKYQKARVQGAVQSAASQIGAFGDMAAAAQGFFDEGSKGYEAMGEAAQTLQKIELAVNMALGLSNAVVAITNQAKGGDAYTAWARMAAMAASMAALGFSVAGAGGGGDVAKERQASAGTGSVLGDASAKSESLANSMEALEDIAEVELKYSSEMLESLRNIDAGISTLTVALTQDLELINSQFTNLNLGFSGSAEGRLYGTMMTAGLGTDQSHKFYSIFGGLGDAFGSAVDNVVNFIAKGFGTSREVKDTGLRIEMQNLATIMEQGLETRAYTDVEVEKSIGWFKTSSHMERNWAEVDAEVNEKMTAIVTGMVDTLRAADAAMDIEGSDFEGNVKRAMLEMTDISIRGLTGEKLQEQFEAVFSKMGDDLAGRLLPAFDDFKRIGEGMFETVTRVAYGVEQARYQLDRYGVKSIEVHEIVERQGDIAVEVFKQSVIAFHGEATGLSDIIRTLGGDFDDLVDTYQALIEIQKQLTGVGAGEVSRGMATGAGGLDALSGGLDSYFENFFSTEERVKVKLTEIANEFNRIGAEIPTSVAGFRTLLESIDTTTESGAALFGELVVLSPAVVEVGEMIESLTETAISSAEKAAAIAAVTTGIDYTVATDGMAVYEKTLFDLDAKFTTLAVKIEEAGGVLGDTNFELAKTIEFERAHSDELGRIQQEAEKRADEARKRQEQAAKAEQSRLSKVFGITDKLNQTVLEHGLSDYEVEILKVNQRFNEMRETLLGLGVRISDTNLEQAHSIELQKINAAHQTTLFKEQLEERTITIEAALDRILLSLEEQIDSVGNRISRLSDALSTLSIARDRLIMPGAAAATQRFDTARVDINEILANVRRGEMSALDNMEKPLGTLTGASTGMFKSFEEYQRNFWYTSLAIDELELLTQGQLTIEERTLKTLNEQIDVEKANSKREIEMLSQQRSATMMVASAVHSLPLQLAHTPLRMIDVTQNQPTATVSVDNEELLTLSDEIAALRSEMAASQFAIARNTLKTSTKLEKFDRDGLPPERT